MQNDLSYSRRFPDVPPMMVEVGALTRQRLDELQRLLDIGAAQAEKLDAASKEPALALLTAEQNFNLRMRHVDRFDRISRAVRQVMVLEFELLGLFEAPERDGPFRARLIKPEHDGILTKPDRPERIERESLADRPDYRTGPIEDVVAGIRKVLGAEPPPNDPFAPRKDRPVRPVQAAPAPREPAAKLAPATVKLPEKPQVNTAIKAAALALQAKLGNGFRMPPAKPKTAKANLARPPKRRRNRGPPK
jgi:hypothetical protein